MKLLSATLLLFASSAAKAQTTCSSSADCAEGMEYCAAGVCTAIGQCAIVDDCFNPNNGPYAIAACVGVTICDANGQCGIECGPSFCPEGEEEVTCETDPCLDFKFGCPAADSCAPNRCGECSPIFFDQAGNVFDCSEPVATQLPANTDPDTPIATQLPAMPDECASDADCVDALENGEPAYCNAGSCVQMGFCVIDNDCKNPSNVFAMIECVGVLSCDPSGQCAVECGPSFCPEGVEEVPCETDPCLDFKFGCPAAHSCAPNTCGECSTIFFDEAGYDLGDCLPAVDANDEFATDPCMSDMDCDEEQYCGDGVCLEMGECTQRM